MKELMLDLETWDTRPSAVGSSSERDTARIVAEKK